MMARAVIWTPLVTGLLAVSSGAAASPYTFAYIPDPQVNGATTSFLGLGLNNVGQLVGYVRDPPQSTAVAYSYQNGVVAPLKVPNGAGGVATAVNDLGTIVGYTPYEGFVYQSGTLTKVDVPGVGYTQLTGINDSGQIVGFSEGPNQEAFIEQNGVFTPLVVPGSAGTQPLGINNNGVVLGQFFVGDSTPGNGFTYGGSFFYANGVYTILAAPTHLTVGEQYVELNAQNNLGQAVGIQVKVTGIAGRNVYSSVNNILYDNGVITDLSATFPSQNGYTLRGINDSGQILGTGGGDGTGETFIATPVPEPATLALFGAGALALAAARSRRR